MTPPDSERTAAEYVSDVRRWLESNPSQTRTVDYDRWCADYNASLPAGEQSLVSYSMLQRVLPWSWETIKKVAAGEAATDAAAPRRERFAQLERGPHDLVALADIQKRFNLSRSSAQRLAYLRRFPAPAYTHPRPPGIRLWRREDIERYANKQAVRHYEPNDLQPAYADVWGVAELYGVSVNTLRGGGGVAVPRPAVVLAGLQLWLRSELKRSAP